jgi:putative colanic acid biosynthesis UDP-glucose lipid carrier transferase
MCCPHRGRGDESMLADRSYQRTFFSAPQSLQSLAAAFVEPVIAVLAFVIVSHAFDEPVRRAGWTLCLLVFALAFPGRNRFQDKLAVAGADIVGAWLMLLGILALCGYATNSLYLFESDVLLAWAIATPLAQWVAVGWGQMVLRTRATSAAARRHAVVVGAGPLGLKVARSVAGGHDGASVVGYFDDRSDARVQRDGPARTLGGLADVAAFVSTHGIREVYITLPLGSQPRILELLESLQSTTASLYFVPDVFGISIIQGRLQDLNGVPVVGICETPFTGINELVKRVSDVVLATAILLFIAPALLAIAIGVKWSSPGPMIFAQRRNGLNGEDITVWKFRTMTTQDNGAVVQQATRDDVRITPFGRFLRRTSMDELPQFFNVLQGSMSIVGPRPHAVAHNETYRRLIKAYMVRHKVKPGITGWAQVNGFRGETETLEKMQARVEYDLEYLRNWSLGLDLRIILRTIRLVFFDRNAY